MAHKHKYIKCLSKTSVSGMELKYTDIEKQNRQISVNVSV